MKNFLVAMMTFGLCTFAFAEGVAGSGEQADLTRLLRAIGDQFDCYFTVEADFDVETIRNSVLVTPINRRETYENLEKFIQTLSKIPGCTVEKDPEFPIYHIADRSLKAARPLTKVVDDFKFEGSPVGLLSQLERKGYRVSASVGGGCILLDESSRIVVRSSGGRIIELLSRFLPLSQYSRVLWIAHTSDDHTEVRFSGPYGIDCNVKPLFSPPSNTTEYLRIKSQIEATKATIALMTRGKWSSSEQLDCTLRIVGDLRIDAAVPALLENLTVQTRKSPDPEEAFPAVYALVRLGAVGATAVLKHFLVQTETQDLRTRNAAYVISAVMGTQAKGFIEQNAPAASKQRLLLIKNISTGEKGTFYF